MQIIFAASPLEINIVKLKRDVGQILCVFIGALRVGRFTILLPAASWTSSCCILTWFSIHGLAESLRSYTHARTYTYTHMLGMVENFSSRPEMDRSGRKVSTIQKKLSRSSPVALACASTRADTHAYTDLRIRFHLGTRCAPGSGECEINSRCARRGVYLRPLRIPRM